MKFEREPQWLSDIRQKALGAFNSLEMEKSQYTKLSFDFDEILSRSPKTKAKIPEYVEGLVSDKERLVICQIDNDVIRANVPENLAKNGVVAAGVADSIELHEDLVRKFFESRSVKCDESKLAAFNCANFSSGVFVHVPDNIEVNVPLHYVFISSGGSSSISQILIDAGKNSKLAFAEQDYSERGEKSFHSSVIEIHAGCNSDVSYALAQNFQDNVVSSVIKRAVAEKDARIKWITGRLGSSLTKSKRDTILAGEGAEVEDVEVFFGSGRQHFDITANIRHAVPNTKGSVLVKGVLRDSARSVSQGVIRVEKHAQKTDSFLAEHTLMLDAQARSDAIPGLEIEANDVRATHSASTSHIDKEQVFYLISRGLPEDEAKKLIVLGFLSSALDKINLPGASENLRALFDEKWNRRG